MQLNPARGRKPVSPRLWLPQLSYTRFMQLNPARGRKLKTAITGTSDAKSKGLCSSTPRGDGNEKVKNYAKISFSTVYAAQPRKGTETRRRCFVVIATQVWGLCSSTPRGDGNSPRSKLKASFTNTVYAAQPREGTETPASCTRHGGGWREVYAAQPREGTETDRYLIPLRHLHIIRFMQLNPARGRKQLTSRPINSALM